MNLDFDTLTIQDFKTWRGKHTLDLLKYGPGLHFLRGVNRRGKRLGSNGSGKSSLWDAIVWCLFGETVKGLKNPAVKPWRVKKSKPYVGVDIVKGKVRHFIERSISPNRLTVNGKDASQQKVIDILGMTKELFLHAIIMGQGRKLFFDLQPREKMDLFVDALELDRWDARAATAAHEVRALQMEKVKYETEAQQIERSIHDAQDTIKQYEEQANRWEAEWKTKRKDQQKALKVAESRLEEVSAKRDRADLALDGAETELRQLVKDFDAALERKQTAQGVWEKHDSEDRANRSRAKQLRAEIAELGKGGKCPTCGQSCKGTMLEKHRDRLQRRLEDLEEVIEDGMPFDVCDELDNAVANINRTRDSVLAFRKKASDAKDDLDTFDRQHAELKGTVTALTAQLAAHEDGRNPHRATVRDFKKKRDAYEADLAACVKDIKSVQRDIEHASYWTKGFKDVRLFVLEDVMAELELATNSLLDESGLVGWSVSYELERETARGTITHGLNIMIQSPDSDGKVNWESWSGGEAQRLRVVGALALSEVLLNHAGVNPSIEVLDEPTTHLSTEGVSDLCEYLSDRARRLDRQIWYVDHMAIESQRFASVTTVRRDEYGSSLHNTGVNQ